MGMFSHSSSDRYMGMPLVAVESSIETERAPVGTRFGLFNGSIRLSCSIDPENIETQKRQKHRRLSVCSVLGVRNKCLFLCNICVSCVSMLSGSMGPSS